MICNGSTARGVKCIDVNFGSRCSEFIYKTLGRFEGRIEPQVATALQAKDESQRRVTQCFSCMPPLKRKEAVGWMGEVVAIVLKHSIKTGVHIHSSDVILLRPNHPQQQRSDAGGQLWIDGGLTLPPPHCFGRIDSQRGLFSGSPFLRTCRPLSPPPT